MARIYNNGFELNNTGNNVEYGGTAISGGTAGVGTTYLRSGSYGYYCKITAAGQWSNPNFFNTAAEINFFVFRFYVYFITLPNWTTGKTFINFLDAGYNKRVYANLEITGKLTLADEDGGIGTSTTAMTTGVWYRVEVKMDRTGAAGTHIVELKIDGRTEVTSSARSLSIGCNRFWAGWVEGASDSTQGECYFDDVGVNDNTGTSQITYPGSAKIVYLFPNAAGDNAQWTRHSGSNNWDNVDDPPASGGPDDGTTYNYSKTVDQIDDFKILSANAIEQGDLINAVSIGVRYAADNAASVSSFVVRIKASAGGTVEESAAITPASTSWFTDNNTAGVLLTPLAIYDLPGASTIAWSKNDLDQTQIGYRISTGNTNNAYISTIWAVIDYTTQHHYGFYQNRLRPRVFRPGIAR